MAVVLAQLNALIFRANFLLKFIYSEKATKISKNLPILFLANSKVVFLIYRKKWRLSLPSSMHSLEQIFY